MKDCENGTLDFIVTFFLKPLTGFRFPVAWGDDAALRPVRKYVKAVRVSQLQPLLSDDQRATGPSVKMLASPCEKNK